MLYCHPDEGRISFLMEITLASKYVNGNLFMDLGSAKGGLQNRNDETALIRSLRIILFSPAHQILKYPGVRVIPNLMVLG